MMISVAWLEMPLCSNVRLRVCRLLAAVGSSRGEVHRCETVSGGFWSMVESEGCKVGLARGGRLLRLLPSPVESYESMFQLN